MLASNLEIILDSVKMDNFLTKVTSAYNKRVQYHNDLHGADVMQMCQYLVNTCNLAENLKMDKLDRLSMIIAGLAHDLGHDGYTNSYHSNSITERAINCNDVSV